MTENIGNTNKGEKHNMKRQEDRGKFSGDSKEFLLTPTVCLLCFRFTWGSKLQLVEHLERQVEENAVSNDVVSD